MFFLNSSEEHALISIIFLVWIGGDDTEDNRDDDAADDNLDNTSLDSDDMADPGGAAAAARSGACHVYHTKPIIPTFAGEASNIFEMSILAQEFVDSFLGYCQHDLITQDKRLNNLDQCLTGVAKKWYGTDIEFVGNFTD